MARVLVIGGTGMLLPVIHELITRGDTVLAVARRPDRAAPPGGQNSRFIPIAGHWGQPSDFVDTIAGMVGTPVLPTVLDGAIVWAHSPHRQTVVNETARVLADDATVVQIWGSPAQDPRQVRDAESVEGHPWTMRHVLLGYRHDDAGPRWLTNTEISAATLRAWDGEAEAIAGTLDPWEQHP